MPSGTSMGVVISVSGFLPKDQQSFQPEEVPNPKRSRGSSPSAEVQIAGLRHDQQPPSGHAEPEPMPL